MLVDADATCFLLFFSGRFIHSVGNRNTSVWRTDWSGSTVTRREIPFPKNAGLDTDLHDNTKEMNEHSDSQYTLFPCHLSWFVTESFILDGIVLVGSRFFPSIFPFIL